MMSCVCLTFSFLAHSRRLLRATSFSCKPRAPGNTSAFLMVAVMEMEGMDNMVSERERGRGERGGMLCLY